MGATKHSQPRGCKGMYVPWVCGTCEAKLLCKPNTPVKIETRKRVRA